MTKLGVQLSNKQLKNLIKKLDQNKDGMIGFEEFHAFFALIPYPVNA
jgi:Ca2+-binding EF-hand superfamily protein